MLPAGSAPRDNPKEVHALLPGPRRVPLPRILAIPRGSNDLAYLGRGWIGERLNALAAGAESDSPLLQQLDQVEAQGDELLVVFANLPLSTRSLIARSGWLAGTKSSARIVNHMACC